MVSSVHCDANMNEDNKEIMDEEGRSAPLSKNAVSAFRFHANYFLLTWKIPLKVSSIHIKHMYIQPFTTIVDWPEVGCLMEVSTILYICRYCVFTWYGRDKWIMQTT